MLVEWQVKRPGAVSCSTGGGFSIIRTPIGPQLRGRPKPAQPHNPQNLFLPARQADGQPGAPHHHHHPPPPLMAIIRRHFTSSSREGLAAAIDGLCRQSRLYVIVFVSVFCICLGLFPFPCFAIPFLLMWECLVQPRDHEGPKYTQNDPEN